jgi:hypothetical protein
VIGLASSLGCGAECSSAAWWFSFFFFGKEKREKNSKFFHGETTRNDSITFILFKSSSDYRRLKEKKRVQVSSVALSRAKDSQNS